MIKTLMLSLSVAGGVTFALVKFDKITINIGTGVTNPAPVVSVQPAPYANESELLRKSDARNQWRDVQQCQKDPNQVVETLERGKTYKVPDSFGVYRICTATKAEMLSGSLIGKEVYICMDNNDKAVVIYHANCFVGHTKDLKTLADYFAKQ